MAINQVTVMIQDKGTAVAKAIDILAKANVNIRALSISDTNRYGILRLVVNNTDKAVEALKAGGHIIQKTKITVIAISDKPGEFAKVLGVLSESNINLRYFYSFIKEYQGRACVAISAEDIELVEKLLLENNITVLQEEDIK
jgi:hypothetical protein